MSSGPSGPVPTTRSILRLRGWIRAQLGDYDGSLADYHRAFEGRPLDAIKLADRASVAAMAGHHKDAETDFEAALRLDPSSPWIRARRARYLHAARGDHQRAVADCDEALRLKPGHAEASLYRGLSSVALDDFRGAVADFDRALDPHQARAITFLGPISSHYPELYRARSEAHRRLGDLDGAWPTSTRLSGSTRTTPRPGSAAGAFTPPGATSPERSPTSTGRSPSVAAIPDLYRNRGDAVGRLSEPAGR